MAGDGRACDRPRSSWQAARSDLPSHPRRCGSPPTAKVQSAAETQADASVARSAWWRGTTRSPPRRASIGPMANRFEVVAGRVDDKGAVVAGVIVRARTGCAVVLGAGGDRGAMEGVDGGAIFGHEREV